MFKSIKKSSNTQFAVLGLGRFGTTLALNLANNDCEVLVVDLNADSVNALSNTVTHAVIADASDENVLKELAIDTFDVVTIAIGQNMQASIVCALNCKELGAKYIIAKAYSEKHATILRKIGVNKIIIPEADSAVRTATLLMNPEVNDIIELDDGYSIAELAVPPEWTDKKLLDLQIRNKFNVNILLILSSDGKSTAPYGDTVLKRDDKIIIGAINSDLDKFLSRIK